MKKPELFFVYSLIVASVSGAVTAVTVHPLVGLLVGVIVLPFVYAGMTIVCNSKRSE